jgi:hypothetical protein
MLPYTKIRGQVLSSTVPAHRMCQALLLFLHFGMLAHNTMKAQVFSSTVPPRFTKRSELVVLRTGRRSGRRSAEGPGCPTRPRRVLGQIGPRFLAVRAFDVTLVFYTL